MEVKDLFYNIPARLKFLRNPNTEFSYIQEIVQSIAVIHPSIAFELKKNGKTVLKTTAQVDLKRNLKEIFSNSVTDNLKEVLKTDELAGLKISGYVSTPDFTRSSKKDYHIYINSRTVKCPVFQKAIDMAYRDLTGSGKYPFVVLNLEIPPSDVDVNVHPTKKEVRYKNVNQVFNFVMAGVLGGLSNFKEAPSERQLNSQNNGISMPAEPIQQDKENVVSLFPKRDSMQNSTVFIDEKNDDLYIKTDENGEIPKDNIPQFDSFNSINQTKMFESSNNEAEKQDNIIGQYKNTYILIELENGLEIVDQHIAEERYNYEKLKEQKEVTAQLVFISDVLSVSATEAELIKENKEKFEKFGYGIEFTSDTELIFRRVPQMLSKVNTKEILSDILENIEGDIDGLEEQILKTTACKASVKAGQKLSLWQMQEIIKKWRTTKMPYTCPHGRPISKIISHKELASWFERNS